MVLNKDTGSSCKKGAPLWMATFADLMSILMALFVLLFALSDLNVNKFKQIAESFNVALEKGGSSVENKEEKQKEDDQIVPIEELKPVYESLIELFAYDIQKNNIHIDYDSESDSVFIRFPNSVAFETGKAELTKTFKRKLRKFFVLRSEEEVYIKVLGHSDKSPIARGAKYRSNLDLSASRASRVAEQLISDRFIADDRIEAIGYGSSRPLSISDLPEEMAKDRRVEILIENVSADTLKNFDLKV